MPAPVLALAVPTDFWSIVLTLGIIAMLASTVVTAIGKGASRGAGRSGADDPAQAELVSPLRSSAANAARERASAAARAKAEAAARARSIQLTDVREVPAGQDRAGVDRPRAPQPAVSAEEAEAIIAHYAEHDPSRLAEVITQWIRSDVKHEAPRR